jgi:hypothetical protein
VVLTFIQERRWHEAGYPPDHNILGVPTLNPEAAFL